MHNRSCPGVPTGERGADGLGRLHPHTLRPDGRPQPARRRPSSLLPAVLATAFVLGALLWGMPVADAGRPGAPGYQAEATAQAVALPPSPAAAVDIPPAAVRR